MMLYNNTKGMVHSTDGDNNFFDVDAGVLQRDIIAPYLFIFWLEYELQTSLDLVKENGFTLKKARSRRYHRKTKIDADFTDDLALLTNTPKESLLHSLQKAEGTDLNVNVNKRKFLCLKPKGAISTLSGKLLKLEDQFSYLSSNI